MMLVETKSHQGSWSAGCAYHSTCGQIGQRLLRLHSEVKDRQVRHLGTVAAPAGARVVGATRKVVLAYITLVPAANSLAMLASSISLEPAVGIRNACLLAGVYLADPVSAPLTASGLVRVAAHAAHTPQPMLAVSAAVVLPASADAPDWSSSSPVVL
jgi:hypothetical protein